MSTTFDRIQMRRGTAAEAAAANPVLLAGEIGFETDTGKFKFGNGVNVWLDLPYANQVGGVVGDASQLAGVAPLSVIPDLSSLYLPSDGSGTLAESQIPDLSNRYDAAGAAAAVSADLQTFKTQTASNEDLTFTWKTGTYGDTWSGDEIVFIARKNITLLGISMAWDDSSSFSGVAGSDTNYYRVTFNIGSAGSFAQAVTQTTQLTGTDAGGSIATDTDWNFDSRTWSQRNMSKGQILRLVLSKTGTPVELGGEFTITGSYQRQAA